MLCEVCSWQSCVTYDLMRLLKITGVNHETAILQIGSYGVDADTQHLALVDVKLFGNYPKGWRRTLRLDTAIVEGCHGVAYRFRCALRQCCRRCERVRRYQHQGDVFVHCLTVEWTRNGGD